MAQDTHRLKIFETREEFNKWLVFMAVFIVGVTFGALLMDGLNTRREDIILWMGGREQLFLFIEELLASTFAFFTLVMTWFVILPPCLIIIGWALGRIKRRNH